MAYHYSQLRHNSTSEGVVLIMKAVTYQGKKNVEVKEVANAKLEKKDDILVLITSTAIYGSNSMWPADNGTMLFLPA
ncbi:hypothetical protein D3C80_1860200 [compost metagenome]